MYRICSLAAVLLFAATVRAEDGSEKKSEDELHGTWTVTTSQARKGPGDEWKNAELQWNWEFKSDGKALLIDRKLGKQSLFRYEVDVTKQPHRIKLEYLGPGSGLKGYRQLGIWKIGDSKLTMHLDPPGSDEYPTEFKGAKQSGFFLELEQVSDEFESPAAARRIEKALVAAVERVAPAVVALDTAEKKVPLGSGIVIDPTGVVLTHGHADAKVGDGVRVRFPDGRTVMGDLQSVHSGGGRDFSVIQITEPGPYPFVPLKTSEPPASGSHCFHLGYPSVFARDTLRAPLLRFGRISGAGRVSVYANCLIMSGDSGGPLFDMDGTLLGVLNYSIGPQLRHPGQWAGIRQLLDSRTWFQPATPDEAVELGFTKRDRTGPDTTRRVAHGDFQALVEPAAKVTVQFLVNGEPAILGTVVAPGGIVLTKRSEVLNSAGQPIGKLTCRTFAPESLVESVAVRAEFPLDDVVFLQVSGGDVEATFADIRPHEVHRGTLVVVPVPGQRASEIGVLGTERPLKIEREPGILPLALEQSSAGVCVEKLLRPGADKEAATVWIGDVITHLNGKAMPTLESFESIGKKTITAGDPLVLTLRRDDREWTCVIHADSHSCADRIHQYQYALVSLRRTGFSSVLSHDAIVSRANCGGPVVDLQGRIVGINIARTQRCSTLALPANRILELLAQMREAGLDR